MLWEMILSVISNIWYLALNVTGAGSFPPPLSAAKEKELLDRYHAEDETARDKLIEHNLRLVAHVVKKYYAGGGSQDDLISIGTIGLIKAVSTFKSDKSRRLSTYAARCIENEILMYFRSLKKSSQDVFIGEPIDTDRDGNALTLSDVIADDRDITKETELKLELEKLKKIFPRTLDRRQTEIITLRYGLGGAPELPQREIAKKLGISRSYVSRIEKAALERLRAEMEK